MIVLVFADGHTEVHADVFQGGGTSYIVPRLEEDGHFWTRQFRIHTATDGSSKITAPTCTVVGIETAAARKSHVDEIILEAERTLRNQETPSRETAAYLLSAVLHYRKIAQGKK